MGSNMSFIPISIDELLDGTNFITDDSLLPFEEGGTTYNVGKSTLVPNIKAGSSTVAINSTISIVFNTPFATTPNVVVSFAGDLDYTFRDKGIALSIFNISTTGFTVRYDEPAGTGIDPAPFEWIATDAGDP